MNKNLFLVPDLLGDETRKTHWPKWAQCEQN